MSRSYRLLIVGLFALALAYGTMAQGQAPSTPVVDKRALTVELKDVTWSELGTAIRSQRGRIVVVDFWADFCIPCKKGFPHLVDLQRRYADQGVVCVSVNLDQPERREAALAFLRAQGAALPNFRLSEPVNAWENKLDIKGMPAVFVFDRDGSRVGKFESGDAKMAFTYENVEALVKDLVASRP